MHNFSDFDTINDIHIQGFTEISVLHKFIVKEIMSDILNNIMLMLYVTGVGMMTDGLGNEYSSIFVQIYTVMMLFCRSDI